MTNDEFRMMNAEWSEQNEPPALRWRSFEMASHRVYPGGIPKRPLIPAVHWSTFLVGLRAALGHEPGSRETQIYAQLRRDRVVKAIEALDEKGVADPDTSKTPANTAAAPGERKTRGRRQGGRRAFMLKHTEAFPYTKLGSQGREKQKSGLSEVPFCW